MISRFSHPVLVMIATLAFASSWQGSCNLGGGFANLPDDSLARCRGANPTLGTTVGPNQNCDSMNANAGQNQVGSLNCAWQQGGNQPWLGYTCVVCGATVGAWPPTQTVNNPPGATNPKMPSTTQQNLPCGSKRFGICGTNGLCNNLATNPNDPNCSTNVTPIVNQRVAN